MITQKQWKIQHLAEHMKNLATGAAVEAARRSVSRQPMVREHAVIAEEARKIAIEMLEALEKNIFGSFKDISFDSMMLENSKRASFLALNAGLLSCKLREHMPLSVFADELRTCALELGNLFGESYWYRDIPAVLPRSRVVTDVFYIFSANSGKYTWAENAHFVQEVLNYCPEYIKDGRLVLKNGWRDMDMPIIKLGDISKASGLVIISDSLDAKKLYAVLADFSVNALFNSHVGINKSCDIDIPVRECWSSLDGSDIFFPDWEKLY